MVEIKQNDKVRMKDSDGKEVVGTVSIVKDYNGDAHVRVVDDGMIVIPTSELTLITDHDVEG